MTNEVIKFYCNIILLGSKNAKCNRLNCFLFHIKCFNRADFVAEGFIQLLNDEDKVGETMRISMKNGIDYHTFLPDDQVPL